MNHSLMCLDLFVCVCVCGGGGGSRNETPPFVLENGKAVVAQYASSFMGKITVPQVCCGW